MNLRDYEGHYLVQYVMLTQDLFDPIAAEQSTVVSYGNSLGQQALRHSLSLRGD